MKITNMHFKKIKFFFSFFLFNHDQPLIKAYYLYTVNSQYEWTRELHIHFSHAFFYRFFSREFWVLIFDPLHSYNCKVFSFSLILSFRCQNIFLVLFLFLLSWFFEDTYVWRYITCRLSYNLFTRHAM